MTNQRVIAVVLNWKDTLNTLECVQSLTRDKQISSIIVVDNEANGHLKHQLEMMANGQILLLEREENLGFSAGVNVGLRKAVEMDGDFILVINNDASLHPNCISTLLQEVRPGVGIYAPTIYNEDGTVQTVGDRVNRLTAGVMAAAGDSSTNFLTWACVLIPIETLRIVGYLDELFFMYWEDVDYAFRCHKVGLRLVTVSEARATHKLGASNATAGWRIQLFWMLGLAHLTRKWGGALWIGLVWRLMRRSARLLSAGDLAGLQASWRGLWIGILSKKPAAQVLRSLGVL